MLLYFHRDGDTFIFIVQLTFVTPKFQKLQMIYIHLSALGARLDSDSTLLSQPWARQPHFEAPSQNQIYLSINGISEENLDMTNKFDFPIVSLDVGVGVEVNGS